MTRTFRYLGVAVAFFAIEVNAPQREICLRVGTLMLCTLHEPGFSSQTAQMGEYPLREFGISVFLAGGYPSGRFVDYDDPGRGCL